MALSLSQDLAGQASRETVERQPRDSRETAERQPRDSRETAERQPRDSREAAERQPRDSREAAERQPRGSREAVERQPRGSREAAESQPFLDDLGAPSRCSRRLREPPPKLRGTFPEPPRNLPGTSPRRRVPLDAAREGARRARAAARLRRHRQGGVCARVRLRARRAGSLRAAHRKARALQGLRHGPVPRRRGARRRGVVGRLVKAGTVVVRTHHVPYVANMASERGRPLAHISPTSRLTPPPSL